MNTGLRRSRAPSPFLTAPDGQQRRRSGRRSCVRVNYAEDGNHGDAEAHRREPQLTRSDQEVTFTSVEVKRAMENATELAVIAARNVWGRNLKLKMPGHLSLKVHAMRADYVPHIPRDAMLKIWRHWHAAWREEHEAIEDSRDEDLVREVFKEGNACVWLSTVDLKADVKAFCIIEPETEKYGKRLYEDIVWLLHLYAHEDFDRYDLQNSLMDVAKEYCRASGISKNVATAAPPLGESTCSNNWIDLLKEHGFVASEDTAEDCTHLTRYQRIVEL